MPRGALTALESQVIMHSLLLPPVSIVIVLPPVTMMGLMVRLCGDMGAMMMLSSEGESMGPPTLRLYAVEPVADGDYKTVSPVGVEEDAIDPDSYCDHALVSLLDRHLIESQGAASLRRVLREITTSSIDLLITS